MAQTETAAKTDDSPPVPPPPKKNKGGRPPKTQDRIPRVLSFFDKVAEIPKDDWGPRARIKIYRTEPSIDRVSLGKKRYVRDSLQPIDEDAIKRATWGGSGSYRLYLTYKAPNEREGKELDSVEVDILDTEYPPRLEPGEWLDLPENAKWKWAKGLLEPPPPVPQTPMSSIVEVMNATNEIRKTAIEEMRQAAPAAAAENPMVTAMGLAKELLTIRADNPMVTMMSEQLTAMRAELAAQRARSDMLTDKLSEKAKQEDKPADPLQTIKSIFDTFKSVREQAADVMPSSGGRSRLGPWMEFFQPVLPGIVDMLKPVAVAIAQQGSQPNPAPRPQIQQTPSAHPPQEDFAVFLDLITPRMFHFLRDYEDPAPEFASWFHDGWGPTAQRAIDTINGMGGVPAVMNFYRASKHWPQISGIEPQFTKFLADVIAWRPETEEPETPPADATEQPVIDLEAEPAEGN
jgi:hypothetical protein